MVSRLVVVLLLSCGISFAQKPFTEGAIVYKVSLEPANPQFRPGIFTLTVKGDQIKKEMKLNGMDYVLLINCRTSKVYSLQNWNGRKYAIELGLDDMTKDQERFRGFILKGETNENRKIAGYAVNWGDVQYRDGASARVAYSKEWKPSFAVTYERFPGAGFLPLEFSYKDASGISMKYEAMKVEPGPIENSAFSLPPDYKIISNAEYKAMSKQ